jgi:Uma2 family endonuclease
MLGVMQAGGRKRPATYDDVRAAPDNVVAELIDGTLYTSPRPAAAHAMAATQLATGLVEAFGRKRSSGPGGWVILVEPELHIVGQTMVPDLAGWRRERMPEMPHVPAFELAPDWLCEVRSPSTALLDRRIKLPKYAEAGVQHVWLVEPDAQLLELFRRTAAGTWEVAAVFSEDEKARIEPFDAIELDLALLWER